MVSVGAKMSPLMRRMLKSGKGHELVRLITLTKRDGKLRTIEFEGTRYVISLGRGQGAVRTGK